MDFAIHRRAWTFVITCNSSVTDPMTAYQPGFRLKSALPGKDHAQTDLGWVRGEEASSREVISSLVGENPPTDLVRLMTVLRESIHAQDFDLFVDSRILSVPAPAWRRTVVAA